MYMNQSMESFENWRDSQYDRPEPDTDTPDEQIVRSYTFDYPNDTVLTYTRTGNSSELMLSFSSEDPDAGVEELMYAGDQGESMTELVSDLQAELNMMFLNNLMNSRNLTRAELSASSNIPESTLRDILNGKAQLDRCEAVTLYNLAYALDVSVEDILEDYWEELALERAAHTRMPVHDDHSLMNFYVLADSMLGRLRATGDLAFIDGIDQNEWVERLYDDGQYRCALFLVGVMDYLCRKNGIWQIARYNEYRELRLDSPVYSLSTLNVNSDDGDFQRARNDAENNAIPELGRYGIYLTEEDIRHPA